MNISKAIDRVDSLKRSVAAIDKALMREGYTGYNRQTRIEASVYVEDCGNVVVFQSRAECVSMLEATKEKYNDEIAKLQPVIDMANAALKGVLS